MRANIQTKSRSEMKEAAETYLGVTDFNPNTKILPSSRKCTEGRASTKRKKSGVESATIVSTNHCDFWRVQGHNKATCLTAKSKGNQLNLSCWGLLMSVPPTSGTIGYENIDPVAPSDVMGLQFV